MKSHAKRNLPIFIFLFLGVIGFTYALGTWNTGFRANDGTDTVVDINIATPVFDDIVIENEHGEDLFVPTKTFAEIKSMWDNSPEDTCLYTEGESIVTVSEYETYASYNESMCDVPIRPYGVGYPYIDARRFQVLEIESPGDLEAYINFRFGYSAAGWGSFGEPEENLKIFLQKEGGVTVPESHFIALYNDGGGTGTNGPDLDYNNDGTDDLYFITIDDVRSGPVDREVSIASEEKVKLFSGTNYVRIEGYDSSGNFGCETGNYTSGDSVNYNSGVAGRDVWFSSGRCADNKLFDRPFKEATIDTTHPGYQTRWESRCDDSSPPETNMNLYNYVNGWMTQVIAVYVPKTMTGYLNFRGEYDGASQTTESFYVYKQKAGGSTVSPWRLFRLFDDGAATGGNPPDMDYDDDGADDFERFLFPDADDTYTGPGEIWADVKSDEMTFFKGTNYMRITGVNTSCEQGTYPATGQGSVGFDSVGAGSEARVWITTD